MHGNSGERKDQMPRSRLLMATILIVSIIMIFSVTAKHLGQQQRSLLGLSFLIIAVCIAAFNLVKEAKIGREQSVNLIENVAQLFGFMGAAFGFYYADQHPNLLLGYGIFLASWSVLAIVVYRKLRKKGYRFLKKRTRPDNSNNSG